MVVMEGTDNEEGSRKHSKIKDGLH